MRARLHRHLSTLIAIAVTALIAGGGPPLAAAVFDAQNADKVDGRHAVGADASASQRAGKLVAANSAGRLPDAIIARAPNADRLDNLDSTALQRRITETCADAQKMTAIGLGGGVTCGADRINGGNAQTLDGRDSSAFERRGVRTIFIRPVGTPLENGQAFRQALATLPVGEDPDAPSATNRWVVKIEPGTFEFTTPLQMGPFVDFEGSGTGTVLTCSCEAEETLTASDEAELRDVKVVNFGTLNTGTHIGIAVGEVTAVLTNVDVEVTNAQLGIGILGSGNVFLDSSRVFVQAHSAEGVTFNTGTNTIVNSAVTAHGGSVRSEGLSVFGGSTRAVASTITAENAAEHNTALWVFGGTAVITDSVLSAVNSFSPLAVHEQAGTAHIVSSMIAGPVSGTPTCQSSYNATPAPLTDACVP